MNLYCIEGRLKDRFRTSRNAYKRHILDFLPSKGHYSDILYLVSRLLALAWLTTRYSRRHCKSGRLAAWCLLYTILAALGHLKTDIGGQQFSY